MRFLIDNALSPDVAAALCDAGHVAVHVRSLNLAAADDEVVIARAAQDDRVLVSADTDFGALLALGNLSKPSFILFRRGVDRRPSRQAALILVNLPAIEGPLAQGAVVVFDEGRIRIRKLPFSDST